MVDTINSRRRQPEPTNGRRAKMSLLIADDTRSILYLLRRVLGELFDEIDTAADGQEALELVTEALEKSKPYSLVLMDLEMPRLGGLDAAKEIRNRGIRCPLIAMSGGKFSLQQCLDAGFNGFLPKPIGQTALVGCINDILGG